tara:strand:- start:79 stop:456 length:378 start_codon:yes stop_codon:yes gene_type:complete
MINNFLIIKCIGNNDKLGLRINKEFFIHELKHGNNEKLVSTILNVLNSYSVQLDENFTVIVNQGPGSFSSIRISLSVARGLEISKKVKIFGYKNEDLTEFNQENIEKLLINKLIEKNLIKPIYLS